MHIQDTLGDVLSVKASSLGWPIKDAIQRIAAEEKECGGHPQRARIFKRFNGCSKRIEKRSEQVREAKFTDESLRTYGIGAQILRDLGVKKMRVLSAPKQMYAISGFDLEISEYVNK